MMRIILAGLTFLLLPCGMSGQSSASTPAIRYAAPAELSIDDTFFSRLIAGAWHNDTTLRAKQTAVPEDFDRRAADASLKGITPDGRAKGLSATATWQRAVTLFLLDPQIRYADIAERALYNGVIAEADSLRPAGEERRAAAQALTDAPYTAYAVRGCDLWVNMYLRSRTMLRSDSLDVVVLQNTSAPWLSDVFMSFKFAAPSAHMRLHLRLPAWLRDRVTPEERYSFSPSRQFYQIVLNGRMLPLRASSDGYITIDREWKSDDVLRFSMETKVRRIRQLKGGKGYFAVQEGPVVYSLREGGNGKYFDPDAAFGNHYDRDVLHTNELITPVYSSPRISDESPWQAVLLPLYITLGDPKARPAMWLREVAKGRKAKK